MDRVNAICRHPLYLFKMNTIRRAEAGRIYCCHDIQHLLDVARLMYIRVLEGGGDGSVFPKELIYAAALLHDIGRANQYEYGTPHDEAGSEIAGTILKDCGFDEDEISMIKEAISGHRGTEDRSGKEGPCGTGDCDDREERCGTEDHFSTDTFSSLLKDADKKSRLCFACEARDTCKWPDDKKNMEIEI